MATVAPPRTPPKPASEEAIAPNGPKVSGKTGKRDEWAVLGDVGEYEYMLARKMAEERAKLPPSPEVLPDLPSHIANESSRLKGGAFDDHYKRAYRVLAERRAVVARIDLLCGDDFRKSDEFAKFCNEPRIRSRTPSRSRRCGRRAPRGATV